ncbi:SGNH hydrolase domain-containing protein, partial [Bradyrhizobium sp.]|uniref:SGNH hydrolase domain-containing protein n=1 Tax=Bradyrhizobium sp. TaxID=376 RepID=UPI003C3A93A4
LYLCHWPIIFFARFIFGDSAETAVGIAAITVAMIGLAVAMYFLVERRFLQPSALRSDHLVGTLAGFWSVILTLAAMTHATFLSGGFSWRMPKAQSDLAHLQDFPANADLRGPVGPVGVLFVGDSLIAQYAFGLKPLMERLDIGFQATGGAGCPILYGALSRSMLRQQCRLARDKALAQLETTTLPIVYTQLWRLYDDSEIDYEFEGADQAENSPGSFVKLGSALEVTIGKLVARGHRVLLIGAQVDPGCSINLPRIEQGPLPRALQRPCAPVTRDMAERSTAPIDQVLSRIQAKWPDRVRLLRPIDYFCDLECPIEQDGILLYSSRIHLSLAGSDYMVSRSERAFREFLMPR